MNHAAESNQRPSLAICTSKRYGVQDVFEVEDLLELRNITKVTKCLAQLSKLVMQPRTFLGFHLLCYQQRGFMEK